MTVYNNNICSTQSFEMDCNTQLNNAFELLSRHSAPVSPSAETESLFGAIDDTVTIVLNACANLSSDSIEPLSKALKILRRSGTLGPSVQNYVAGKATLLQAVKCILQQDLDNQGTKWSDVTTLCWQFLVNICVNNPHSQALVWSQHSSMYMDYLSTESGPHKDLCRMIIYLMELNEIVDKDENKKVLSILLRNLEDEVKITSQSISEYLQFNLEHFCCQQKNIVPIYASLDADQRITFLYFVVEYLRSPLPLNGNRVPVSVNLTQYICKEFKKKSDCVLKTQASYVDSIHPKEVCVLLEVICTVSGDDHYSHILATDSSLFLNAGCLLQTINQLGGKSENIFTPVSKLGQVAPNSKEDTSIERDISFELKSMLVRTIGNLAYKNPRNQELAREMDILLAVLNCTNVDARNPLIKEWSVLAIRNLCFQCPVNQALIRDLTKVGDADNADIVKEFNLDLGSMRIGESK